MLLPLLDMKNICKVSRSTITFWKRLRGLFLVKQLSLEKSAVLLFSTLKRKKKKKNRRGVVWYNKYLEFSNGKLGLFHVMMTTEKTRQQVLHKSFVNCSLGSYINHQNFCLRLMKTQQKWIPFRLTNTTLVFSMTEVKNCH